jgi:hypothetical protein
MSKRTPKQIVSVCNKVLAFVRKNPLSNAEAISVGTKLGNAEIFLPIKYLLKLKLVKAKGKARGTRYMAGPKDGGVIVGVAGPKDGGVIIAVAKKK